MFRTAQVRLRCKSVAEDTKPGVLSNDVQASIGWLKDAIPAVFRSHGRGRRSHRRRDLRGSRKVAEVHHVMAWSQNGYGSTSLLFLLLHAYAYMHIYTCSHLSNRTNIKTITYPHMCTNMNSPTHIHTLTHTHTCSLHVNVDLIFTLSMRRDA